jgi:hypothetical protein
MAKKKEEPSGSYSSKEELYDKATQDKTATASIGTLPAGAKTGAAVKTIKLLAQSTGEFTRDELKKDAKLSWTDKTKAEIAAAKGGSNGSTDSGNNGTTNGGGSNQGGGQNGGGTNTGGDNGGNSGGDNGGGDNNGGMDQN